MCQTLPQGLGTHQTTEEITVPALTEPTFRTEITRSVDLQGMAEWPAGEELQRGQPDKGPGSVTPRQSWV